MIWRKQLRVSDLDTLTLDDYRLITKAGGIAVAGPVSQETQQKLKSWFEEMTVLDKAQAAEVEVS